MATYTTGTRTVTRGLIGTAKTTKEIQTILCDGVWYADVPAGEDAGEIIKVLNERDAEDAAYRAQFATEEEWLQHLDENAAG